MVSAQGVEFHKFPQKELHSLVEDRGTFFPHFSFTTTFVGGAYTIFQIQDTPWGGGWVTRKPLQRGPLHELAYGAHRAFTRARECVSQSRSVVSNSL